VRAVALSADGSHAYTVAASDDALTVFRRDPASGRLTFVELHRDGARGVDGLASVRAVALSSDGAHVYTAAPGEDAVTAFRRAADGGLAFIESQRDGEGGVEGLDGATGLALSPDGAHVYVAASTSDAVATFRRDPETGRLAFVGVARDDRDGVVGLERARAVTVSPDGRHVYTASPGDDAVVAFARDPATGALAFIEVYEDRRRGVTGLDGPVAVVLSGDGAHLYAAGEASAAVAVFARDPETGRLTFLSAPRQGVDGVDGLREIEALAITPDAAHLYAAAGDNAVTVFRRDPTSGRLTFAGTHRDGAGAVTGLDGPSGVTVAPDGRHVYVAARRSDALLTFGTACGDGVLDPGEGCDDGGTDAGDGCSAACRPECVAAEDCVDGDPCSEDRCRGGACANPDCGAIGSLCRLARVAADLGAPACEPLHPKLRRLIARRLAKLERMLQRASRWPRTDPARLSARAEARLGTLSRRAARVARTRSLTLACRSDIEGAIALVADDVRDMLLGRGVCWP
jgi:cysteine-rich repeat protein